MSVNIQVRRGTAAAWTAANPTLAAGEIGLETDTKKIKFGDGATTWNALGYPAAGVSDGDKGDITVSGSGATFTIDNDVVTYAKMQNVSATSRILGRITAGAGDTEELTAANVKTILALAQADISGLTTASSPQFTGIELGHASDTSLTRLSAGVAAVEGKQIDTWDTVIVKASTESVASSTAVQNDDELFFATVASANYAFEMDLLIDGSGSTVPDFKMDMGEDGTNRGVAQGIGFDTALAVGVQNVLVAQGTTMAFGTTGGSERAAIIRGTYFASGGTFRLRWAQNTSNASATRVLAGSILRYRRIN